DHDTPRNEVIPRLAAKIVPIRLRQPCSARYANIGAIKCGIVSDANVIARCMGTLDDVGRSQLIKWNPIWIFSDPENWNEDVGSNTCFDEIAHGDLVTKNRIHRIKIKQLAPLDFFREGLRPQQTRIPTVTLVVLAPHPHDYDQPIAQTVAH